MNCTICREPIEPGKSMCDDCAELDQSALEDELNTLFFVQEWDAQLQESLYDYMD
jgi:hypothetical protein